MYTETLVKEAVVGQQTTLTVVDAILLANKVKSIQNSIFKGGLDERGNYVQFYGRLTDKQMKDIADVCVFINTITKELGVEFNEAHLALFGVAEEFEASSK